VRRPVLLAPSVGLMMGVLLAAAAAQPRIPPNAQAGRERERFIESPIERFLRPGPYVEPPVAEMPRRARKPAKRRPRDPKPRAR
jgi:hypothetical protein